MADEHTHDPSPPPAVTPAEAQQGLDLAGQSLGDALRLSFRILTVIIVLLLAFFFGKGFFRVPPDQKVIILRFGKADPSRVKSVGLNYAFPKPINEVVHILIKPRNLDVNTFWPRATESAKEKTAEEKDRGEGVERDFPGAEDAYMLTGDFNILEARWSMTYRVKDDPVSIVRYFKTVELDEGREYDDELRRYAEERVLMKVLLQAAVVKTVAELPVGAMYPNAIRLSEVVEDEMKKSLEKVDCGIELAQLKLNAIRPPQSVRDAFNQVLEAHQAAEQSRQNALKMMRDTLNSAAGPVGMELGKTIDAWWAAKEKGDQAALARMDARIAELFRKAEGEVKITIVQARDEEQRIEREAKGDADRMNEILRRPPNLINLYLDQMHVTALKEVLAKAGEKFIVSPVGGDSKTTMEMWLYRHPDILKALKEIPETR